MGRSEQRYGGDVGRGERHCNLIGDEFHARAPGEGGAARVLFGGVLFD